jgi:hypothetical protein
MERPSATSSSRSRVPPPNPWRPGSPSPRTASPAAWSSGTGAMAAVGRWPGKDPPLSCPASSAPPRSRSTLGFSPSPCRPPAFSPGSPSSPEACPVPRPVQAQRRHPFPAVPVLAET